MVQESFNGITFNYLQYISAAQHEIELLFALILCASAPQWVSISVGKCHILAYFKYNSVFILSKANKST